MINGRLPVIVCGKRVTHLQNKTILRACEVRSQCVSFALPRSLKLSLSHSLVLHIVLRISLVLPVFLLHPTAKIWRDFSTSSPLLISHKLRLSYTKLYIFLQTYKRTKHSWQAKLNTSELLPDHVTMVTQAPPSVVGIANSGFSVRMLMLDFPILKKMSHPTWN